MAKVTKATREVVDIDDEIKKVTKAKKEVKKEKEQSKKKNNKKEFSKTKKKKGIVNFFKEVRKEMKKVKWPSRKDMVKYSFATISFIIFFALFFYAIEIVIALLKAWV